MKYHIWTEGCQMNVADSLRVSSALEHLGYKATQQPEEANVIVLNTCVVRQSAEDKAYGRLSSLRPLKEKKPQLVINLMGCLVGVKGYGQLKKRFPFVDVFSPPSDPGPLVAYLTQDEIKTQEIEDIEHRFFMQDNADSIHAKISPDSLSFSNDTTPGIGGYPELLIPEEQRGMLVSSYVPVVLGCSHACTFCIIPYRRGVERSRPAGEIAAEVRSLVSQGVREVTLLGQIVDRYGKDLAGDSSEKHSLSSLLHTVHDIEGLERIRFLTSHPNWMTDELLETVAMLPKVMPHIEVPVQAGDDRILEEMKRGYTADDYRRLVARIRQAIPGAAIATDIIVGFPGETEEQFQNTYDLLEELRLDVAHLARYSTRPGTVAARRMEDNVPETEKWRRFRLLEEQHERIAGEINALYLGKKVDVLFESKVRGRWRGRTTTNKLVFVASDEDLTGRVLPVQVSWTGPWSMQAVVADKPALEPLAELMTLSPG